MNGFDLETDVNEFLSNEGFREEIELRNKLDIIHNDYMMKKRSRKFLRGELLFWFAVAIVYTGIGIALAYGIIWLVGLSLWVIIQKEYWLAIKALCMIV